MQSLREEHLVQQEETDWLMNTSGSLGWALLWFVYDLFAQ